MKTIGLVTPGPKISDQRRIRKIVGVGKKERKEKKQEKEMINFTKRKRERQF
jgi:hypothetical protein